RERYPGQSWFNALFDIGFKQDEWHTYTCEWDTALISFYVDGNFIKQYWKYYQTKEYFIHNWLLPFLPPRRVTYNQGSYCSPNGTYKVMPGFPYNNTSESNLRFTIGVDDEEGHNSGFLGQMEIDYVKA